MKLFSFPNPVNEVSARLVAGGVVILTLATIVFQQPVLLVILAYGFVARVLTGPTLSPLGQFVTSVLTPALPFEAEVRRRASEALRAGHRRHLSVVALILYFGFGLRTAAFVLVALITIAATLESVFAICLGCKAFAVLMRMVSSPTSVRALQQHLGIRHSLAVRRSRLTGQSSIEPHATTSSWAASSTPSCVAPG